MELLFLLPMLLAGLLLDAATGDDPDEPAEDEAAEPAAAAAEDSPEEPEEEDPEAAEAEPEPEPERIEGFDPAEDRMVLDLPPDAEGEVQLLAQDGGTLVRVDGADIAFLAGVPPQAIGPETLVFGAEPPAT